MSNMKNIYENLEDNNKSEIIELIQNQILNQMHHLTIYIL